MRKRARNTQPHTFELNLIRFSKTPKRTFQTAPAYDRGH